ncbi:MAG: acyl carrier protein [Bryobacter sp.]|jgi:acyl carrier protein|nr:acyl carrier protein [Bryobacter sp.]
MEVHNRILELVRRVSKKDVSPANDESLFDSGILDSFALTDLVSALEKEFGISIPDSDLNPRKFESLDRISSYLESRR